MAPFDNKFSNKMSRQAEIKRVTAAINLEEAMRQARRYLNSEKPNVRLVQQKAEKVTALEMELREAHFTYCEKSNTDLSDEEAKKYIEKKSDAAIDCVDECMLFIDENQSKQSVGEAAKQKSDKEADEIKRCRAQVVGDERYAKDISKKIGDLVGTESYTIDNMVLMKTYNERIQEIFESLNRSWNDLISYNDINENVISTLEVSQARSNIQDVISSAVVFIEKCSKLEDDKKIEPTSPRETTTTGTRASGSTKNEKIKNPTFSGDIRTYAKFQKDFKRIVEPNYKGAELSYVLRESCLEGPAKALVSNIDDVEKIWEKLTDRYGDKMHLVEVVIKELNELPVMKGTDDRKFIAMVDLLERGLQDLEAIDARAEIANELMMKMLEGKLSRVVYLNWLKEEPTTAGSTKFEKMFTFLTAERKRIEKLVQRIDYQVKTKEVPEKKSGGGPERSGHAGGRQARDNCLIHPKVAHFTRKCREFLAKSSLERAEIVKANKGCLLCLSVSHVGKPCPHISKWKPCDVDDCGEHHSRLVHEAILQGFTMHITSLKNHTLLLMQRITTVGGSIFAFFDNGSTITLVSASYVKKRNLKGIRVTYELITVGNRVKVQQTYLHEITLLDSAGKPHVLQAYEIDDICGEMKCVNVNGVVRLFKNLKASDVQREAGSIELLIGMEQIAIHPRHVDEREGMVLFSSIFGTNKVLGGSHKLLGESDNVNAAVVAHARSRIVNTRVMFDKYLDPGIDGMTTEQFGVMVVPKCEDCKRSLEKCKWCSGQINQMSRKDQEEYMEIHNNLELDPIQKCWKTVYPYRCDPSAVLENNYQQAESCFLRREARLLKLPGIAEKVDEQYQDFIKRGVYSEISEEEDRNYVGPRYYVTVHEVIKEESSSTPVRLVTNSSLKYKGVCVNDVWKKGPNTLNNMFGVQLRFRCHSVALVCDISKMYHSVKTKPVERHIRRVLYRPSGQSGEIKIYGTNTVQFGDRPAAAIATIAVKKTAELYKPWNPKAAQRIIEDSYVDDIATGEDDVESVKELQSGIEAILEKGGFKLKGFVMSGDSSEESLSLLGTGELGRILGIGWDPSRDVFIVIVRINLSKKRKTAKRDKDLTYEEIPNIMRTVVTKAILLSIVNSCYDPIGLLVAITIQMRIAMREICKESYGWDDELPEEIKIVWVEILQRMKEAEKVTFRRCVRPSNSMGDPQLIISSDGSELAICATAHIRWECSDGTVCCQLWSAKARVAPLKKLTIPKLELQAAVMGTRLAKSVVKSSIWKFSKIYRIIDSECTLSTLKKDSYALPEFQSNRVTECLESSKIEDWYHTRSRNNISDLGTRNNATVEDISEGSEWQEGKRWMYLPVNQWPVTQDIRSSHDQEEETPTELSAIVTVKEPPVFEFERLKCQSYEFVVKFVAIIIKMARSKSFRYPEITVNDLIEAETYIIGQCMSRTRELLQKGHLKSLRAEEGSDGIIRIGSRALEGLRKYYEQEDFPILAYNDPIAFLWMKKVHRENHSGVLSTVAKSRRKFWIVKAPRLAAKIRRSCFLCRLIDKMLATQIMAPLPASRQMMSPTFHEISLDLFGPFEIKDVINKRKRKKIWGIVFNCLASRALHIDVSEDYGAESVIETVLKFTSLRGTPSKIYSDKGSQLMSAAEELKAWAINRKIEWHPFPAEGQHQNGTSEALVKSIKRSLTHVIGSNVLTFSGIQLVFYEVADLLNSRPIGVISSSDPTQPVAITPNHLLLGRSTSEVVIGSFNSDRNPNKRLQFLQSIVSDWWKVWYQRVLPSLVPSYKWLQRHRNVQPGDVCLIRYKNEVKGTYRLGRVKSVKQGADGAVRTVTLIYKNPNEKTFREVDRSVHGIAVIVPIEEQSQVVVSDLNPDASVFEPKPHS